MTLGDHPGLSFVDNNVLVYFGHDGDRRSSVARTLISDPGRAHVLCTSIQVLQETFVTLTRKGNRVPSAAEASDALELIATFPVVNAIRSGTH